MKLNDNTSEEQFELADKTLDTVAGGEGSASKKHTGQLRRMALIQRHD